MFVIDSKHLNSFIILQKIFQNATAKVKFNKLQDLEVIDKLIEEGKVSLTGSLII